MSSPTGPEIHNSSTDIIFIFCGEKLIIVLSIDPILIKALNIPVPALQEDGGSLCKSLSSFRILLDAIEANMLQGEEEEAN